MTDPLCLLYYPMRRKCYWWSIVMLLRPTVIAVTYNARNRGTGLIQEIVDWRLVVIVVLVAYSTVQASFRPFKLRHESQLDSVCVALLVVIFGTDIQKDLSTIESNRTSLLVCVFFAAVVMLVAATVLGWFETRKVIRCTNCPPRCNPQCSDGSDALAWTGNRW